MPITYMSQYSVDGPIPNSSGKRWGGICHRAKDVLRLESEMAALKISRLECRLQHCLNLLDSDTHRLS
jgi:hypothetical protein